MQRTEHHKISMLKQIICTILSATSSCRYHFAFSVALLKYFFLFLLSLPPSHLLSLLSPPSPLFLSPSLPFSLFLCPFSRSSYTVRFSWFRILFEFCFCITSFGSNIHLILYFVTSPPALLPAIWDTNCSLNHRLRKHTIVHTITFKPTALFTSKYLGISTKTHTQAYAQPVQSIIMQSHKLQS